MTVLGKETKVVVTVVFRKCEISRLTHVIWSKTNHFALMMEYNSYLQWKFNLRAFPVVAKKQTTIFLLNIISEK